MKRVFNTLGADTTTATQAWLMDTATRFLHVRDCYMVGPPMVYPYAGIGTPSTVNYGAYPVVDSDYPIEFQGITYQPFAVKKDKLEYKTGFEVSKLALTLAPREYPQNLGLSTSVRGDGTSLSEGGNSLAPYHDPYGNLSSTVAFQDMRQGFASSDWYMAPVTMTRMFMPTPGDTTTYGGAVMFRGRISEITVDRLAIQISVSSLMEIFTQKVPSQIIEPGNRWISWASNPIPDFTGSGTGTGYYSWFEASFTGGTPADNTLREGWGVVTVAGYGSWERRYFTNIGNVIYLLEPLPVNLGAAGGAISFTAWKAGDTVSVGGQPGQGFPSVPRPEIGVL